MNADANTNTPWSVRFRRERERTWTELEALVERCERGGIGSVGPERLTRLPVLYRATLSSLGVARANVLDKGLLDYLESLVARAYLVVYAPRRSFGAVLWRYLAVEFPAAVRAIRWHAATAALLLVLGTAIAWAMVERDPEAFYLFIAPEMSQGRDPSATTASLRETLFGGGEHGLALVTFAIFLFVHNSSVGILTYGLGFVFGLPVVLLLFYNGMILGAMSALFHSRELGVEWWSWILPHGVTELTAIVLCGGAGLHIGHRVVFPGEHSRLHELAASGRRMAIVVAGAVGMLLLAGLVEGIFRQAITAVPVRYALAAVLACAWAVYFAAAGRGARA